MVFLGCCRILFGQYFLQKSWPNFTQKSNFSLKLGHLLNFSKGLTALKVEQFLKQAPGTKWEQKALPGSN